MNEESVDSSAALSPQVADIPLMFFPVSLRKLAVMSICTLGLYYVYWQFCHWLYIRDYEKSRVSPGLRGFFAIIFCYPLFRRIQHAARLRGVPITFPAGLLALGWLIFVLLGSLPTPFFLVYFLPVLFVLPVQKAANEVNALTDPNHNPNNRFTIWNKAAIAIGGAILALGIVGSFLPQR